MSFESTNARILIVDDDPALLDALSDALSLRMPGLSLTVADSGAAALLKVAEAEYDAIISDIKMPGMDGIALLAEIRNQWPDIPVLLITGHGETDMAIKALRGGAYDLIQKPLDRDYVVAALKRAIEARRMRQALKSNQAALEAYAANLELEVAERTQELVRANKLKDEFLSMAAHELRTPTTTILAGTRLLRSRYDAVQEDVKKEIVNSLAQEATRLYELIEDLLAVGKTELVKETVLEPIAITQAVKAALAVFSENTPDRTFKIEFAVDLPPVLAEPAYFRQVMQNLLSNAHKYSPTAGPVILQIKQNADGLVEISVLDNGPGVPEDETERIFELFYRSPRTAGKASGKGLGLSVCKRLVEAQGGEIWAENRVEGGLTVCFTMQACSPEEIVTDFVGVESEVSLST